uniref:Uncharacterized protein n=1 Tax=Kalanchoe fedtschenkoi TaxID=63787 RepID=A0A7N0TTF5_KALFE
MVLILKDNGLTCEAVHEMKQEAVEVCHESFDADPFSSESEDDLAVSGDELGLGSQLDEDSRLMEGAEVKIGHDFRASDEGIKIGEMREVVHLESLVDGGIKFEKEVHPATPVNAVDDVVSEDLDYEGEDGSEGSSGGMTDSSAESNVEIWPVESLEKLSQDIRNEKTLNEVVDADVNAELISAANGNRSTASGIHQNKCFDDHVSRYNREPGLATKGQMVGNSTRLRVWLSSVLLTLLVLLAALLAQHTYLSPALTGSLSSITTFFDQVKGCRDSLNTEIQEDGEQSEYKRVEELL